MRILILSASVGAGHVRAAEALELKLKHLCPEAIIANYDVLTLMPPAFRKVYRDGYFKMVARTPRVLGWLYDSTDKPFHHDTLQHQIERAGASRSGSCARPRIHYTDSGYAEPVRRSATQTN